MKLLKLFLCLGAVVAVLSFQEVRANVFAAELSVTDNGADADLNFVLNDNADTVDVKIYNASVVLVRTINAGAKSKGANTVNWDKTDDGSVAVPAGNYTFTVTAAQTTGYSAWTEIDKTIFYSPHGVDVQAVQSNPNFGRIYVTESGGTSGNGRTTTGNGIFVMACDQSDVTGQGDAAHDFGGVFVGTSTSSPYDIDVADDGAIFVCDWTDGNAGIWVGADTNLSASSDLFASLLPRDGNGLRTNGSSDVCGSLSELKVEGTDTGKVLYWMDEDANVGGEGSGSIIGINVGNATDWTSTPTVYYPDLTNGNLVQNFQDGFDKDGQGGWWIAQYRSSDAAAVPSLLHYTGSTVDWNSGVSYPMNTSARGSIALSADKTQLAISTAGTVQILDVTAVLSSSGNVALLDTIDAGEGYSGTSSYDMIFGPAGNLYVCNASSEWMFAFSPPSGANSFETSSPAGVQIPVVSGVHEWLHY